MGLLDLWNKPEKSIKDVINQAIDSKKDIAIKYRKFDGTVSTRQLSNIAYNNTFEAEGFHNAHIKGHCSLRDEDRTFKIDRIISVEILR